MNPKNNKAFHSKTFLIVGERIGANQQANKIAIANPRFALELTLRPKKRFEIVKNIKMKIFENSLL